MEALEKLLALAKHKQQIDLKRGEAKFMNPHWLLDSIRDEVEEVREELKADNKAYLEDELSDILWGWMILVEKLKDEHYVGSHKEIMKRALKKYEERILPLNGDAGDHEIWREVKGRQKEALGKEKKKQNMKNFRKNVRDYYKAYYENGDEAHLIDHADSMCNLALKINNGLDEKLIILASYLHDMFNATNRPTHNKLAYEYVLKAEDKFLAKLSKDEVLMVAHAVLEHRASFKGVFYSGLSAIISSADRGLPDLDATVIRSMKFNKANAEDVYAHIKDKYGSNGYAKYPDVYREIFREELEAFKKLADEVTVERILEIWKCRKD